MRAIVSTAGGTAALFVAACTAAGQPQEAPAVLVEPSAQTRGELARAVAAQFGGVPIPLADDALTRTSELVLERAGVRDAQGLPANGRESGRPELFHLLLIDGRCVLVHDRTGHRATLATARCAARIASAPGGS